MNRALSVRPAQLDDLDSIVELRLSLLLEYRDNPLYAGLRPDANARAHDLFRAQILSHDETIFVAERRHDIVGVLRCVDTPSSPLLLPARYCYVSSVYVRPAERRKGVLHALLAAAERWCEERGITEMRLHNSSTSDTAERAWSALGFDVVEHVRRRELPAHRTTPQVHEHVETHR